MVCRLSKYRKNNFTFEVNNFLIFFSFLENKSGTRQTVPTLGCELCIQFFQFPDGTFIKCELLDTNSQNYNFDVAKIYLPKIDCCFLVYDITNKESFEQCKNYCREAILRNCKKDVKVMLIGNKSDLEDKREVSKEIGLKFANENNYFFRETSCLNISSMVFETFIINNFKEDFLLKKIE